jgi:uncharacterized protein (DUF2147 family)
MKKLALSAAFMLAAGAAFAADPLEGVWQTQEDAGSYAHVTIAPCGPAFCGIITESFKDGAPFDSENHGKMIVINMLPEGGGSYAGQVWRPSNNKIYVGGIELSGNSMKLAGCVAGGLFCKKQTWTRVN